MGEKNNEKFWNKLNEISERLARAEIMARERMDDMKEIHNMLKSHENRIAELESHKHSNIRIGEGIAFLIMAGLALWGVLK